MRGFSRAILVAITIGWVVSCGGTLKAEMAPHRYILALQKLQDQMVVGDKDAYTAQREYLKFMAKEFAGKRVFDWQETKNAEALLIYLLSGGNPVIVSKLLSIKNQPNLPKGVLPGAFAFVHGRYKQAETLLQPVEIEKMAINVQAQVGLIKAIVIAKKDRKKALQLLARVRLLKPGTLLEEASLRRAIALAGANNDIDRFMAWSSQYVRRFERSYFLPKFISVFSFHAVRFDLGAKPALLEKMSEIVNRLTTKQQASVYLTIARAGVLEGKSTLARLSAKKAQTLLKPWPRLSARAQLYLGASMISSTDQEKVNRLLVSINEDFLDEKDRKILAAALRLSREISKKPGDPVLISKQQQIDFASTRKLGESKITQTSMVVKKAQALIDGANKLLKANTK